MLNLDSRSRSKLVWIATLLSPVVAVQGVRFLTDAAPATASAATAPEAAPDMPAPAPAAANPTLSSAQAAAVKWLELRSNEPARRSPMDRPDQAPADVEPSVDAAPVVQASMPTPTDAAPRDLVLTGILDGGSQVALCAINHRIRRLGEEVWPGWSVARIDGRSRQVLIAGPAGRTAILSPPTPSLVRFDE